MPPATLLTLAAFPLLLIIGACALWLTQRPATVVAVPAAINDVVAEELNIPVTMIYLQPDGALQGLAVQIQRLHGRRKGHDAILTGFDAFDERRGKSTLFDFSRVLTMVDANAGELLTNPAAHCCEAAGLTRRPEASTYRLVTG